MPGCLLPAAMAAGLTSPAQWGLHVPQRLDTPPPPSVERVVYGTPLAFRQDSEHFSLQWETPALDAVIVAQVEADMEAALMKKSQRLIGAHGGGTTRGIAGSFFGTLNQMR